MGVFRNAAGIGLTYLTAIMTLFAGFPHFEGRWPNGQIKRFGFAEVTQELRDSPVARRRG
jgi:hypothetical protein